MADREKTIKGLECHIKELSIGKTCYECPYFGDNPCEIQLIANTLELLKEQETGVSPKEIKMYPGNVWACGNCGHVAVGSLAYKAKYCPECGKAVKWE